MAISNKKRKRILRGYPGLTVDELSENLGLRHRDVIRVLEESGISLDDAGVVSGGRVGAGRLGTARVSWPALLIISAVVLVVYANSLQNNFHYDDFHSLTRNIHIRYLRNIPRYFVHPDYFSSKPKVAMPRPILLSTFALNYGWTGYNAWSWLLVNILLHLANALILYVAICHLAGKRGIALIAALIFAVHPVNTEAVNYINCRSETLGTLFILLTIYFFCRNLREGRRGVYVASLLCYAVGLLTKETVFVVPALLVVIDALFIFRPGADSLSQRFSRKYLGLILVSGAYLIYRHAVLSFTFVEKVNRPVFDNILTQTRSLIHYLNLLLYPIHLNTSYENIDYTHLIQDGVVLNILLLAAILAIGLVLWRRVPLVTFFVLNFFISLAPTSSLIPLNAYLNEHRVYLPCIGFALLAASALEKLKALHPFRIKSFPSLVNLIILFIITIYVALSVSRNFVWKTDMTLWTDTITKSPHKAQVISDLGNAFYRSKPPNIKRAAQLYHWSVRMDRRYFKAYHNLGTVNYTWAIKAEDPEQRPHYFREAEKFFKKALKIMPVNAETWNDLGSTYIQLRNLKEAKRCYQKAVTLDHDNYKALQNLGLVTEMQERLEEAIGYYKRSIQVYDRDPLSYYLLGRILANKLQRYREALRYFKKAYELAPGNSKYRKSYEGLDKYLKTHPNSSQ